jgi:hypothetical protein
MATAHSAANSCIVSRSSAREEFGKALRIYIGRGRRYSVKQASNGSGVADRMIESFMADPDSTEYRKPDLEEVLSLSSFLGEAFATEWLRLAKLGAFALPDEEIPSPGELVADCANDTSAVAAAAADGHFDPHDRERLVNAGLSQIENGMTLVSLGGRRRRQ